MSAIPAAVQPRLAERPSATSRFGVFAFGLFSYAVFFIAFTYAIGFVGNWVVPKSIDSGTPGPLIPSLLINGALLLAFVVQHTIMARPAFKRWWTRIVPRSMERSIFVLLASSILLLMYWQWRPLPEVVWHTTHPALVWGLSLLSLLGYGIVLYSSFLINHFDLFGLRQVWLALRARTYGPVGFRLTGIYKLVRHPLMLGFLIAFWSTPTMTVGHLFFAIMTTAYIFFGTHVEERDLVAEHGADYLDYRRRVRGLVPLPRRARQRA
ncbi:MAG: isoprenylcysteine carboxylmethyltransferase family protein [Phycisphaeraceae bacterium]|nr:isoprenylcysteine carboxylmethyltransferase family protein [Phycisphaeraceae bacterium]